MHVAKAKAQPHSSIRYSLIVSFALLVGTLLLLLLTTARSASDDPYWLDSTLGELAIWMADQAIEDAPESLLGRYAQQQRLALGTDTLDPATLLMPLHTGVVVYVTLLLLAVVLGAFAAWRGWRGQQTMLVVALVGLSLLLFIFPPTAGNHTVSLILLGIVLLCVVLLIASTHLTRVAGFLLILSLFMVAWEGSKALASRVDFAVSVPLAAWEYESYPTLADAADAVVAGDVDMLLHDRRDLDELMAEYLLDADAEFAPGDLPYPDLRFLRRFERSAARWGFPLEPEMPGRVGLVVTADNAPNITGVADFDDLRLAAVADEFAETDYLQAERSVTLVDLRITNDLNLPHLQSIAEALLQPARRNGPLLLIRILADAALYTWTEALLGFVIGGLFGFLLGTLFAHVALLQRSLLPYVIASQTIPIIALAPMIVIWLRDTHPLVPVAVIAAYLTFFPVTINTLRGLQSPEPSAFDLMQSYAASRWQTMWKLRFPAALPFIFTALKVSATASVVGAIIGELPSGIRDGLGRAILDFSSDYSLTSTPKLWGAIFVAAIVGILFFVIVSVVEQLVLRGQRN